MRPIVLTGERARGSPWKKKSTMNVVRKATLHITAPKERGKETKEEEKEKPGTIANVEKYDIWQPVAEWEV